MRKYGMCTSKRQDLNRFWYYAYTVRNYLHGLQNSGESIEDSDLHAEFGPLTW